MESTRIYADGKVKHHVRRRMTPVDTTADPADLNNWMPRHSLNRTLYDHLQAHHADAIRARFSCYIT